MRRSSAIGLLLLAASLATAWWDAHVFFAAWLAAWWWCLGVVLGSFVNAWMHRLTGGAWGEALRPAVLLLSRRMPWLLLLFVPLLPGLAQLAAQAQGGFAQTWLSLPLLGPRLALYALAWWALARPASLHTRRGAALSLALHGVLTSLASVDLLMALMPGWSSTGFALVVLGGQALAGCAVSMLLAARTSAPVRRDLGNLLLMWTLLWAYLAFMEFLVIWSENLPHEIAWYLPRRNASALALVLVQGVLPSLALLWRRLKDDAHWLRRVAALSVLGSMIDAGWWVLPSAVPQAGAAAWALLAWQLAGMALLLFGGLFGEQREPEARSLRHAAQ